METLATQIQNDTVESVLQSWADARSAAAVVIGTGQGALTFDNVMQLWSQLIGKYDQIDLIIDSNGGDPHSAYQVIELLRRHLKDPKKGLTAVVPFRAASAATLMCLGCDAIMLDELARLGPLDMQVYEDLKGGRYRYKSALNPQIALEQLAEHSLAHLRATKRALVRDGVLPDEAYEIASRLTIGLFEPLYAQVNPERLAELKRANDVMRAYAKALLQRYSALHLPEQVALTEKLVSGYPSHGYFIDIHEAEDIRLPVIGVPNDLETLAIRLLTQVRTMSQGVVLATPQPIEPPIVSPSRERATAPKKRSTKAVKSGPSRALVTTNGKRGR